MTALLASLAGLCGVAGSAILWPNTRVGVCVAAVLAALAGLPLAPKILADARAILIGLSRLPTIERLLAGAIGAVIFLEGLASMAPLTGSDALHYHFTAPLLFLKDGFHVNWFLPHIFFTGMSHQLILAGLALGSEKLATGWIFLGGASAAIATAHLARQWTSGVRPYLDALTFLLTPVAFWQATACLAGALAGGIAGAKYTGLILAASLFLAFAAEIRTVGRSLAFFAAAAAMGVWPYVRNWAWSGDPLFPFLMRHLAPERINQTALAGMLADTGASEARDFWRIVGFPFFASVDQAHLGFWQLLGPLILALAPLVLLAVRRTPLWRVTLIVWITGALGIGLSALGVRQPTARRQAQQ